MFAARHRAVLAASRHLGRRDRALPFVDARTLGSAAAGRCLYTATNAPLEMHMTPALLVSLAALIFTVASFWWL